MSRFGLLSRSCLNGYAVGSFNGYRIRWSNLNRRSLFYYCGLCDLSDRLSVLCGVITT